MIAISRIDDEYFVANTSSQEHGYYKEDGTFIRGINILPKEEVAWHIWKQKQLPSINEAKLREMWKNKSR